MFFFFPCTSFQPSLDACLLLQAGLLVAGRDGVPNTRQNNFNYNTTNTNKTSRPVQHTLFVLSRDHQNHATVKESSLSLTGLQCSADFISGCIELTEL